MRWIRVGVVVGLLGVLLLVTSTPAHACSCAAPEAPSFDVTAVAVEDLGYEAGDGFGEQRAWHLEVVDGRLGAATGSTIRISMLVGEQRDGDSFAINGCGMDDNLIVGQSYEVVSVGLEGMISCSASVAGPRLPVPDRAAGTSDSWPLLVAAVAVGGAVGAVLWSRQHSS
ncbi:MAG: hypothetical protein ACSLFP_01410 [Acidimicrobiales bacterium]